MSPINVPDLAGMVAFVRVAEMGSFVRASEALDLSKSAVSKQLTALERRLGTQLLHRTTRRLSLTEAGQHYLRHAQNAIAEARAAEDSVANARRVPQGRLRVAMPSSFGLLHVAPLLGAFLARYPEISVDLLFDDREHDLVAEGIDLAIRLGKLPDTSMMAKPLARSRALLCASPDYLGLHGRPASPDALATHDCLHYSLSPVGRIWDLRRGREVIRVALGARLAADSSLALLMAATAGAGIARLPEFVAFSAIQSSALEVVLPDWRLPDLEISAVMPERRYVPAKVKVLTEFLSHAWRTDAGWATKGGLNREVQFP